MNLIQTFIAIVLAAAATAVGINYLGPLDVNGRRASEANRLINEGQQIQSAAAQSLVENGQLPGGGQSGEAAIVALKSAGYLADVPTGAAGHWRLVRDRSAVMATVGLSTDANALAICRSARKRLLLNNPDSVPRCDGSDSPDGRLGSRETCCIEG